MDLFEGDEDGDCGELSIITSVSGEHNFKKSEKSVPLKLSLN